MYREWAKTGDNRGPSHTGSDGSGPRKSRLILLIDLLYHIKPFTKMLQLVPNCWLKIISSIGFVAHAGHVQGFACLRQTPMVHKTYVSDRSICISSDYGGPRTLSISNHGCWTRFRDESSPLRGVRGVHRLFNISLRIYLEDLDKYYIPDCIPIALNS